LERDPQEYSLNYFKATDGWSAVTRTTYGGPEYSGRGGLQVVTVILAVRREQLAGYGFNPLAFARAAMSLGYLRLPGELPQRLPALDFPNATIIGSKPPRTTPVLSRYMLDRSLELLRERRRVALLGVGDRFAVLEQVIQQLPKAQRSALTFTTGLKPSLHRPFALHVYSSASEPLRAQLTSQSVHCVIG
jgi:hypothetical protein